jgi:hypothetical protein
MSSPTPTRIALHLPIGIQTMSPMFHPLNLPGSIRAEILHRLIEKFHRAGMILHPIRMSMEGDRHISIRILRRDTVGTVILNRSGSIRDRMGIVEAISRDRIENIEKLNRITMRNFQYTLHRIHQKEE